jgi:O-succinylbenzoic acid--CoA ligase
MERIELAGLLGATPRAEEAPPLPIAVEESDPERFMDAFATAVAGGGPVFLADPSWGTPERDALARLRAIAVSDRTDGWLMVPSGGTSGALKFARHDEGTIDEAVRGFCARFGSEPVNCLGVLPLHHVSGLMAWMRSALTGGCYLFWDWKRLEAGDWPREPAPGKRWFLSLVPTQLQRLLPHPAAREHLRRFEAVFLGGGPAWPELLDAAAAAAVPLAPSYGLTETAAMVSALSPKEFLAGARNCGTPLPHARIDVASEAGNSIRISGGSIFRGYFPEWSDARTFTTDDEGRIDAAGHLHVLGRRDAMIISGGKKIDPSEVEAALRASGALPDVAVIGLPDPEWGQAVVACYPADSVLPARSQIESALAQLSAHKRPRRFVAIDDWPRTAQGKINRPELIRLAASRPSALE